MRRMSFGYVGTTEYDVAQVCLNGHVVNHSYRFLPQHNCDHCSQCGEKTIIECPECQTNIRGQYRVKGFGGFEKINQAPAFCHKCGASYPWTESRLSAAREYVRELDRLTENERGILERSLDDLLRDTPNTQVAALRFKTLTAKVGPAAIEVLKGILIEVVKESAKKAIWGP
jgi:hypothetical protein